MATEAENATSLKQLLQAMAPHNLQVLQGKVLAAAPLQVQVLNDSNLVLGSTALCLPKHLTDYTIKADIKHSSGDLNGSTITLHNGLKAGELVYLLSYNKGKRYLIIDRVEVLA